MWKVLIAIAVIAGIGYLVKKYGRKKTGNNPVPGTGRYPKPKPGKKDERTRG